MNLLVEEWHNICTIYNACIILKFIYVLNIFFISPYKICKLLRQTNVSNYIN